MKCGRDLSAGARQEVLPGQPLSPEDGKDVVLLVELLLLPDEAGAGVVVLDCLCSLAR